MQQPDASDVAPTVIFLHIPKTAGGTLARVIERQYSRDEVYAIRSVHEFAEISHETKSRMKFVRGHMGFGLHTLLPQPATYITFLRDPVERVISLYYYVLSVPTHFLHWATRRFSLEEFVARGVTTEVDNTQTRYLAGSGGMPAAYPFGECPRDALDIAMGNLERSFGAVGLVEEFDTSLLLMLRRFAWNTSAYTRVHVTHRRPLRSEIPRSAVRVIEEHTQLDHELYECARRLLHDAVRRHGPWVEQELARLRRWNMLAGPALTVARSVEKFGRTQLKKLARLRAGKVR